ncbi:MAG TPA: ankyrin repeat domain-containing protein [Bryobacteraceae bacterium]|nr:ankyrin repeat domain-containing protein [Bryobacteraceae bacterium]
MANPDPRFVEIKELHEVCKRGDVKRARELLQAHPDVLNSPDYDTRFYYPESCLWSPLGLAAWRGHEELVRFLLEAGANPVPFEVAAQYHQHIYGDWTNELRERGYRAVVEAIEAAIYRQYGPPIDEGNIRQAVRDGDVERVHSLVKGKPERVRQIDAVANAPLHLAVAANNLEMVQLLVESGSPVDARNGNGRTPAVIALFGLHRWWRNEEKREILDFLLKSGAEHTTLIAATLGDEARIRELLRADPSRANAADPCWRRPLSGAASKGHTSIVRLLLDHGADPNAKEAICQGGLSLHEAAGRGFIEIVQLLLEKGAIPEHWVDSSGDSVFAAQRHPVILHLLYSYGGTMELQVYAANHRIDVIAEILKLDPSRAKDVLPYGWDDNGSEELALNIMRLAIRYGARFENASLWNLQWTVLKYPKVYKLLQLHGANPDPLLLMMAGDIRRHYKNTEEHVRTVAFLVEECGANVNYRNEEGITPLAGAGREGNQAIVEYLLAKGANPNTDGPDWTKPLSLAERRGHSEIANVLRRHGAHAPQTE